MTKKVSVIGAGNVGATIAQYIAEDNLADVVLIDILEGLAQGKALDLVEAGPVRGFNCSISGSNNYQTAKNSDIVVITAGLARKPGLSRDDLLAKNTRIIKDVVEEISQASPQAVIIVVTNPLDIMAYLAQKISQFPPRRVIGMAGVLDSARLRAFIALELNLPPAEIQALVLGGHGDTMVPLPRYCTVSGKPLTEILPAEKIAALVERTRKAGGEIVGLLKTGSAYYSTGAAVVEMVSAILRDKKQQLPCAAYLTGEYGIKDIYLGVPVILGAGGAEKIVELPLSAEENTALEQSAAAVKRNIDKLTMQIS